MTSLISCPNCNQPADPQTRYCQHCGVDLALAAVWAEQNVMTPLQVLSGVPMAPEILVPRIGDYLIEKGTLTPEGLQQALKYQGERSASGQPLLLGQALLELGLIDRETLDEAITVQILQLQGALRETNRQLEDRVQERTRDLQLALERLSELNQLKSNFIANISHELRTPLTHIKGYLDILKDEGLGPLTPAQGDALGVIQRAEERLERLIEDLIQFSLASRGELSLNLADVQLSKTIQSVFQRVVHYARTKHLNVELKIPDTVGVVNADEEKIGWVLLQLLENAIKFTQQGGKVRVQVEEEDGLVQVAVSDTGIGIPPERLGEIFEPFHQLDGSSTRRYGGTGLGLAMVRRIIEAHGSQLHVESMVGRGTRFSFSLPVESKVQTKPESERSSR